MQMQKMQPRIKELKQCTRTTRSACRWSRRGCTRARFQPFSGLLARLATLPVFIGLYRALSNAASEGLLTDGFYWIPSLGGPTSIASRNAGSGFTWLWPFVGHPPRMARHACYLVLPVLLVASQYVSQQIISPQPKTDDPAQQQSQAILKFLPLMIGFFSLAFGRSHLVLVREQHHHDCADVDSSQDDDVAGGSCCRRRWSRWCKRR